MNLSVTWLLLLAASFGAITAPAALQLLPGEGKPSVFAGDARKISLVWYNDGKTMWEGEITARVFQTSSTTAIRLGEQPWKRLQVLPGQTVEEAAQLDFPAVNAKTEFLIQWVEGASNLLGRTTVLVYPTNLLKALKPLAGEGATGVFDPQNQLKPLLKNLQLTFNDLENSGLDNFSGRLAIIEPFPSEAKMRAGLAGQIKALAKKGTAIVWIQPPRTQMDKLVPSFYSVGISTNTIVIVQPELVVDLPVKPQSQLNLIYFCNLAMNPWTPNLPSQP